MKLVLSVISSLAVIVCLSAITGCFANLSQLYQQEVAQMCADPQRAYETGYNNGMKRHRMDTDWASQCRPEQQTAARDGYISGYHAGAQNAPNVMTVRVGDGSHGGDYQTCTFSSDCGGDDMSCRQWNGDNVCMGYGAAGDPCWFGSDCLSGSCDSANGKVCK